MEMDGQKERTGRAAAEGRPACAWESRVAQSWNWVCKSLHNNDSNSYIF